MSYQHLKILNVYLTLTISLKVKSDIIAYEGFQLPNYLPIEIIVKEFLAFQNL